MLAAAPGIAATQDAPPDDILRKMLTATAGARYADFLKHADDAFKAGLTKQNFDGVAGQLSPRLKGGHTVAFLGRLRQGGHEVFLWKLSFKDGGDDNLVKMAVKAKLVAGFWIQ